MGRTKWPAGEWEVRSGGVDRVYVKGGARICQVMPEYREDRPFEEDAAAAKLIAQAPAMYALLAELNEVFYVKGSKKAMMEVMAKTKPLMKKARGEA